jgi:DNA-binding response OmpR family regulator
LSRRQFAVLQALAANEGRVLSCQRLDSLSEDVEPEEPVIDAVLQVQEVVDEGRAAPLICAVGSVGYALHAPEPALAAA